MTAFPSAPAVERRCRCGTTVLTALDEGVPVRAEVTPTTEPTGLAYVRTDRGYLRWANPDQPGPTGPIHPEHRCRAVPTPPAVEPVPTLF